MLRSLFGLLAINGQDTRRDAETQTNQSCDRTEKFPPLGPTTSIWVEVRKVPFKMAGIYAGDEPLNEGRLSFLWVMKTKGDKRNQNLRTN